ncbi:hypothetical protein [Pontibacillus halophilus]|uniref:hypothetical protein n=1 Tax=Pontibacillus halophilus TaxID=516704 RepID=UPI000401D43E|nr:hypothetical protein [Pontibacillus halophilus]
MDKVLHWFWSDGLFFIMYALVAVVAIYTAKTIMDAPVKEKYNQYRYRFRLRKNRAEIAKEQYEYTHPFLKHLYLLINTTSKSSNEQSVLSFLVITSMLFISSGAFMFFKYQDPVLSFIVGALTASIPYMFMQLRLRKLRYTMGQEFLSIIQQLTQNYNANQFDMYQTLVVTQAEVKNKQLREVMLKLISDLHVSKNEDELKLAIQVFVYTSGTSWAKRLGNIIIKGYLQDENVLNTLLILSKQMEQTEEMLEEEKSHTVDVSLNGYLTIPVFLISLVLSYNVTRNQDWIVLQFQNQWALLLFIISVIGSIFSVFIAMLIKQPKNDI